MGIIHIGIFLLQRNIKINFQQVMALCPYLKLHQLAMPSNCSKWTNLSLKLWIIKRTVWSYVQCTLMALKPLLIPNNNYFVFHHHNYYNLQYAWLKKIMSVNNYLSVISVKLFTPSPSWQLHQPYLSAFSSLA